MSAEEGGLRILIVAPIGRDADLMCTHLAAAGMPCQVCRDIEELCRELNEGAGALLFTEEALTADVAPRLGHAGLQPGGRAG